MAGEQKFKNVICVIVMLIFGCYNFSTMPELAKFG